MAHISSERLTQLIAIAKARYTAAITDNLNPVESNLDATQQAADLVDALVELEERREDDQ